MVEDLAPIRHAAEALGIREQTHRQLHNRFVSYIFPNGSEKNDGASSIVEVTVGLVQKSPIK
jgi:hypothetical protein